MTGKAVRRHLAFSSGDDTLIGTLDEAGSSTGLLIVSGGNEIRAGAFNGQAELASRIAAAGHPVFRFDRAGVGDSTGENRGFRESGAGIEAALAAFRREQPHLTRVLAFGNCDAASALMLGAGHGCDGLSLANPWTFEHDDGAPTPQAIRARYAGKLKNPREWVRLVSGGVSLTKLAGGVARALRPSPAPSSLALQMRQGLDRFSGPSAILLAQNDRTAQAFLETWDLQDRRLFHCPGAGHAFAEPASRQWLLERLLDALS